jgi:arginase
VGAPSSLGIRPYDDGEQRHLNWAVEVFRRRNVISRLGAIDFGDVDPPAYHDYARPLNRPRNEAQVVAYSRSLAQRVAAATAGGRFGVVLGGDCSIALGCLLGAQQSAGGPVGLAYVDAHADFSTPEDSTTGSVSGMCLSLALGRGDTPLARLDGDRPLVNGQHVALIGRRQVASPSGMMALASSSILDLSSAGFATHAGGELAAVALARVVSPEVGGFWIHLDVDVLNPAVMSAVDSPEPGGMIADELVALLAPLVHHPRAVGLDLSIYDPALDADRSCARLIIRLLEQALVN